MLYDGAMDRFALNPMKGYNGTDKFSSFDPSAPTVLARSFVLPAVRSIHEWGCRETWRVTSQNIAAVRPWLPSKQLARQTASRRATC